MAWQIEDSVQRGEIDNRERGIIRGKLWINGFSEPVTLQLKGNACPDLAGCLLTFENPLDTFPLRLPGFEQEQKGVAGELTASRKVRVIELNSDEMLETDAESLPEHLANSLYLEWYSESNGRIVLESANYKLSVSSPAWHLTPEEEEQRQQAATNAFNAFIKKLDQVVEETSHHPPEDKEWDEFDYERFMRESDARTDKYMELLEKYGESPEAEEIIAREMGWDKEVSQEEEWELQALEESDSAVEIGDSTAVNDAFTTEDLPPREPDPAMEGIDWVRREDGDICHPLYLRCYESSLALIEKCEEVGLLRGEDREVSTLIGEYQITTAKLAGTLNTLVYGRDIMDGAFVVARLKRALNHLHSTQSAFETVAAKKKLSPQVVEFSRGELFAIREEILRLMQEFRGNK